MAMKDASHLFWKDAGSVRPPDICDFCGAGEYDPIHDDDAEAPEARPIGDWDASLAFPAPAPPAALRPEELLRLGALTLQEEQSEAVEQLVTQQEETYRAILRAKGAEPLIEALLDRDRQLARTGREMASGRTGGRLLREFIRGALQLADYRSVRAVGDATKTGQIEKILEALGAEPTDLRQLKLHGSTLGELGDRLGEAEAKVGEKASMAGASYLDRVRKEAP